MQTNQSRPSERNTSAGRSVLLNRGVFSSWHAGLPMHSAKSWHRQACPAWPLEFPSLQAEPHLEHLWVRHTSTGFSGVLDQTPVFQGETLKQNFPQGQAFRWCSSIGMNLQSSDCPHFFYFFLFCPQLLFLCYYMFLLFPMNVSSLFFFFFFHLLKSSLFLVPTW